MGIEGAPALYSASRAAKNVLVFAREGDGITAAKCRCPLFRIPRYGSGKICHFSWMIWNGGTGERVIV